MDRCRSGASPARHRVVFGAVVLRSPRTARISSPVLSVFDVADAGVGLCRGRVISRVSSKHPWCGSRRPVGSLPCSLAELDRPPGGDAGHGSDVVGGARRRRLGGRACRRVSRVSRGVGALTEYAAGLCDELEAVVRVPRSGERRMGRCRRRRCCEVRVVASLAGRQRDRARRGNRPAGAGHGEPASQCGLRLLRASRPLRGEGCVRAGGVASPWSRRLQAVPASRVEGTADRDAAGEAAAGQANTADIERRGTRLCACVAHAGA
jgi:hypothetical protein